MISAPYRRSSCERSSVVLSGITIRTGWPSRAPSMARLMPVLPLDGSRIVWPLRSAPEARASSIIARATRSLSEPVGLAPSSLAQIRMRGDGDSRRSSTMGVWPMVATRSTCLPALVDRGARVIGLVGAAGHGRQQDHRVIRADRRLHPLLVANVAIIDVDVD